MPCGSDSRSAASATGATAKAVGDAQKALGEGDRLDATYELPLLAHRDAGADELHRACESRFPRGLGRYAGCWAAHRRRPCRSPAFRRGEGHRSQPPHWRRPSAVGSNTDYVEKAVRIAKQVPGPVEGHLRTREEGNMQHDVYRPAYLNKLSASMLDSGRIVGWTHRIAGSSVIARWLPGAFQKGIDIDAVDSAVDISYDIPNLEVEYVRDEPLSVPTGFWAASVQITTCSPLRSFVDELAHNVDLDPYVFRRDMLSKTPRLRGALQLVSEKVGWGTPMPERTGRGIATQVAFGSFIATVAEVAIDDDGRVRVRVASFPP